MGGLKLEGRPQSLSDVVYQAIYDAIVNKVLVPGATLNESQLASELSVSKTPVREALLRLREIGLIENGLRGLQVISASPERLQHAYELRMALEAFTAGRAAETATREQAAEIMSAAAESLAAAETQNIDVFREHDRVFHDRISKLAANPPLTRLLEDTVALINTVRQRDLPPDGGDAVACGHAHVSIATAIAEGDAAAAAESMTAHLQYMTILMVDLLKEDTGG